MERTAESTLLHIMRIRLLQDFPAQIAACLEALSDEQLWWRPNEQANAAANVVLHLAGSNRYYFEEIIAGRPIERDRDAEFAVRGGRAKTEILNVWDASLRDMTAVLQAFEPSQLMTTTDRTGKTTTFAQVLLHVSHHNATHLGQLLWITKMLAPGALDDVGRRLRGK